MTQKEILRLRDLARHQRELAGSERNRALFRDWEAHGRVDGRSRPMLTVELGTFGGELIGPMLQCESPEARDVEFALLSATFNFERFRDDTVVCDHLPVSVGYGLVPFGLPVRRDESGGLGHHFVPQIVDLAKDFDRLGPSTLVREDEASRKWAARLEDTVGDILPVRRAGTPLSFSPMGNLVRLMGMENLFLAMCDEPELFHAMMEKQTDDLLGLVDAMERDGALLPTVGETRLPQGSYCFTDDLPATGTNLVSTQVWGYLDSQETSGVSPDMFHEFVFPYYKRLADRFGLLSYGCCEAVHPVWEASISRFANLRKVSISPWCDETYMGDALQGRKVVYLRKPSPNFLGVDPVLDEAAVRSHLEKTVAAARGLTLEFAQRDVYTVHGDAGKVARYVEILRSACEKKR